MESIATLLGLTVSQLTILTAVCVVLVVVWYVLRSVLKTATRVFSIGCVGIAVLLGALYLIYAFVR